MGIHLGSTWNSPLQVEFFSKKIQPAESEQSLDCDQLLISFLDLLLLFFSCLSPLLCTTTKHQEPATSGHPTALGHDEEGTPQVLGRVDVQGEKRKGEEERAWGVLREAWGASLDSL